MRRNFLNNPKCFLVHVLLVEKSSLVSNGVPIFDFNRRMSCLKTMLYAENTFLYTNSSTLLALVGNKDRYFVQEKDLSCSYLQKK